MKRKKMRGVRETKAVIEDCFALLPLAQAMPSLSPDHVAQGYFPLLTRYRQDFFHKAGEGPGAGRRADAIAQRMSGRSPRDQAICESLKSGVRAKPSEKREQSARRESLPQERSQPHAAPRAQRGHPPKPPSANRANLAPLLPKGLIR